MKKVFVAAMALVVLVTALSVPGFAADPEDTDAFNINPGSTYCFNVNPFVDKLYLNFDPAEGVVYGTQEASYVYPALGLASGTSVGGLAVDFEISAELNVKYIALSTWDGYSYYTMDGSSYTGPTYIWLTPCSSSSAPCSSNLEEDS